MPYRILFVCTGNTCRSPMAAALLENKQLPGVEVKSAGVFAAEGSEASAHAKTVLKEKGIEAVHRSSQLKKEHIDWATHVLAMTSSHKDMVVERFPEAKDKTFTLKQFVLGTDGDIADPFGGPVEVYRAARDELEKLIDRLAEKLQTEQ
ncbi:MULTISPECIES: low molecular weight protein arginine phosphatase [Geobacillus]|uniref:Low molecular weight phosphatase family protein n=1 Tax=Geobacillus thermocatenulatus TaxID=33938 RepID=A0A226QA12_9BACL|nr:MULTISPECIES: low molecular weight protein arginine phosphatase [Geobacillus]KPC99868.1 Low molecular weight protein-tyrosine-phosphatase YwlE [Geobacillus sp. BCO2]RAN31116.1 phosphatase [Geobacillus sp. A8]ASS97952.1 low molecular weight phosphatase family protein [Geobacillus thermocatenulatus]KLR74622.1 phosphatase [Geobacillus sp. T6]OXB88698.1 low molecular weight phosphatase family protein [Geobacillus thermocatenulatus]